MLSIPNNSWAPVLVSGLLQIGMFPVYGPVPEWRSAICWFALVPLLMGLAAREEEGTMLHPWRGALLGYGCGVLFYFGNCFWIYQTMYHYGGLSKPVAGIILILFSLYLGLYHALFAYFFTLMQRSWLGTRGALMVTPFVWVAVELARARITGFPWDLLGYTQVDNQLVSRLAPLAGVMGISFVVALVNVGVASFLVDSGRRRWVLPALASLIAMALQGAGTVTSGAEQATVRAPERAVMMQENLEVGAVGKQIRPLNEGEELEQFSRMSLNPHSATQEDSATGGWSAPPIHEPVRGGGGVDVIVWPEAPSHLQSNDPVFLRKVGELARQAKVAVISGSLGVDINREAPRGYFLYDSASLFDPSGSYAGRYDKIHLVPWGEYIPFKRFFSFAEKLTEGVGDMDAGHDRSVFRTGGHGYGVFICYESIFGDEVRQFVKNGADVLVNISDDGWYGDTGAPWQHLNMARMRAIENDRWVLRSTNTGITTAIDPRGRVGIEAPRHVRGAFVFPFGFVTGTTFYTRHGDWLAWICAVVTMLSLSIPWVVRGRESALV